MDNKQETSTSVIFISLQESNISFGVGFAYYSVRQSRATVDNRLKFPRLVFYNGFLLETKEQKQIQLKNEDIKIYRNGSVCYSYVCEPCFL